MSTYVAHFGLSAAPFTKEIDDQELWLPPCKREHVDELLDALAARLGRAKGRARRGQDLRAARAPPQAPAAGLPPHIMPQRDARPTRLPLAAVPRPRPVAVRDRGGGVLPPSPPMSRSSTASVFPVFLLDESHLLHQDTLDHLHPAQLRMGPPCAALPRAGRACPSCTTASPCDVTARSTRASIAASTSTHSWTRRGWKRSGRSWTFLDRGATPVNEITKLVVTDRSRPSTRDR